MERPYVIRHILSSLDGKINGPFMETEAVGELGAEYGKYRTKMNAEKIGDGGLRLNYQVKNRKA